MAEDTPHQPTLPEEGLWTAAELAFKDDEPPGLFPDNQDSNFGLTRKTVADRTQEGINQQLIIYQELFVDQAQLFLDEWEKSVGLPANPPKSEPQRRAEILNRLRQEVFTRERVKRTLDVLVGEALAGQPITLTPSGHPFVGAGSPLYAESVPSTQIYRIYEDVRNFKYYVDIVNTVTPDMSALQRELLRITPAGITYTVDNTVANIYHYERAVLNDSPVGYWKLGTDYADYSGYARTGTVVSAPALVAAPGLLNGSIRGSSAARDFDGIDDAVTVPHHEHFTGAATPLTVEAWIRPDVLPATDGTMKEIVGKGVGWALRVYQAAGQDILLFIWNEGGTYKTSVHQTVFATGTTYHVAAVYKPNSSVTLWVNGVKATSPAAIQDTDQRGITADSGNLEIARWVNTNWWNGVVTNLAIYNYALSDARITEHYKVGKNLA